MRHRDRHPSRWTMVARTDTAGAYHLGRDRSGTNWLRSTACRRILSRRRRLRNPHCAQQQQYLLHGDERRHLQKRRSRRDTGPRPAFPTVFMDANGGTSDGWPEDGHRSDQSQHRLCRHAEGRPVGDARRRRELAARSAAVPQGTDTVRPRADRNRHPRNERCMSEPREAVSIAAPMAAYMATACGGPADVSHAAMSPER